MTRHLPHGGGVRHAAFVGLAALLVATTSLPVSAARVEDFTPMITENPACTDGTGNVRSSIPGYPDAETGLVVPLVEFADDNNVDTVSTFVKGNRWCERVDWRFAGAGELGTCEYMFYVPNDVNAYERTGGGADATIVVGFYNVYGQVHQHSDPIPEANLAGFTTITIGGQKDLEPDFTGVNLGDNTGQTAGSAQIGWGAAAPSSLRRVCTQ